MAMKLLVSVIIVAALMVQQSSCVPLKDCNDGTTGHNEIITENITEPMTAVKANSNDTKAVKGPTVDDEVQWTSDSKNRVVCRPVNPIVPVEGDQHEYHYVRIDWNQTFRDQYVVHVAVNRSEYDGYGAPATDARHAYGADARHLVCRLVNETEPGPAYEHQPSSIYSVKMINVTGPVNGSGDFHVQVVNQSGYKVYADGENVTASQEHRINCHFDGPTPQRNGAHILCTASPLAVTPSATNSTADSEDHSMMVPTEMTPTVTTTTGTALTETTTTGTTPTQTTTTGTTPTETTTTGTTPTETTTTGTTPTETTTTGMTPTETMTTGMTPTETTTGTTPTGTTLIKDNKTPSRRTTANLINSTESPKEGNVICRLASQMVNPNSDHTHYIVHLANNTRINPNISRAKTSRSLENHVYCWFSNRSNLNTADYKVYQVYLLKDNTDVNYGSYSRNLTINYIHSLL